VLYFENATRKSIKINRKSQSIPLGSNRTKARRIRAKNDRGNRRGMDDWLKVAIGAAVGGILTLAAAVATGWFSFASKNEELRVHLVEIAIGILRADPKDNVTPARAWAIDVIEKNSGVPFLAEDREALLHRPIQNVPNPYNNPYNNPFGNGGAPFGGAGGYGGALITPFVTPFGNGGGGAEGYGGTAPYNPGGIPYTNPYTNPYKPSLSTPSP
jgi:hypothetical protein